VPQLLIASHILPWGGHPKERTNPRNGLCLARTHDAAFDAGLITLDEKWRLVLSSRLRDYLPNQTLEENFKAYEGKPIQLPDKFQPDGAFMRRHREEVFAG
jgi:predicted restriction endonuclease